MKRSVAVLLWAFGCGTSTGVPEVGTDDGDHTDGSPPVEHIEIAMRPRERVELVGVSELVETESGLRMELGARIDLAVGAGYPEAVDVALPDEWWACGWVSGALALDTLSAGEGPVLAELRDARTVRVRALGPGVQSFVGHGSVELEVATCELEAGTVLDLALILSVGAHDPTDARIALPCGNDDVVLLPGAVPSEQWFSAELLDDVGEPYVAANADPDAQLTVELHGQFDAEHASPTSLRTWIAPSRVGRVDIVPALGDPLAVEIVSADRVVAVPVEFQLAGTASGPRTIVEGERYGEEGWGRAANRIAPMLIEPARTTAGPLCSDPSAQWFELESRTPAVCTVVDLPIHPDKGDSYTLYGTRLGQAARLERAGTCTLELHAPGFAPEAGFPRSLSAEFADPTGLHP